MEFDETRWREIQGLASVPGTSAPKAVVVALNSIIDRSVSAATWSSMDTTASTTAWKCWVRPLADIIGIRYGAYAAEGNPTVFYPAEPIKVIFSDGAVSIPAGPIPIDQRAEVSRVITALREFVKF